MWMVTLLNHKTEWKAIGETKQTVLCNCFIVCGDQFLVGYLFRNVIFGKSNS